MTLDQLQEYCLAHDCFAEIDGDWALADIYENGTGTHLGMFSLQTGRYWPT